MPLCNRAVFGLSAAVFLAAASGRSAMYDVKKEPMKKTGR